LIQYIYTISFASAYYMNPSLVIASPSVVAPSVVASSIINDAISREFEASRLSCIKCGNKECELNSMRVCTECRGVPPHER
jgi:hypothetical protein